MDSPTTNEVAMGRKRYETTQQILIDFDAMTAAEQEGFLRIAGRYAVRALLRIISPATPASSSSTESGSTDSRATRSSRERGTRGT